MSNERFNKIMEATTNRKLHPSSTMEESSAEGVGPKEESVMSDKMDRLEEQVEKLNETKNLLNRTLDDHLEGASTDVQEAATAAETTAAPVANATTADATTAAATANATTADATAAEATAANATT